MQQLLFAPYAKAGTNKGKAENEGEVGWEMKYDSGETETFRVQNDSGYIRPGSTKALKYRDMSIKGHGLTPITYTEKGAPQADSNVIRVLAGNNP